MTKHTFSYTPPGTRVVLVRQLAPELRTPGPEPGTILVLGPYHFFLSTDKEWTTRRRAYVDDRRYVEVVADDVELL